LEGGGEETKQDITTQKNKIIITIIIRMIIIIIIIMAVCQIDGGGEGRIITRIVREGKNESKPETKIVIAGLKA
jgi:hypothetical protein